MANNLKTAFLAKLRDLLGDSRKLEHSQSLYEFGTNQARVYIRYSKVHPSGRTFFGLRQDDLRQLEGRLSFICFLWDGQTEPLIVPFVDYEDVFQETAPAPDGQYKAQIYLRDDSTELYIARAGRFAVDGHIGWAGIEQAVRRSHAQAPVLSHPQVQTLLGAVGHFKSFDVWIPPQDRDALDWSMTERFRCIDRLPVAYEPVQFVLQEIDVVWLRRGSNQLAGLYEVEHSTPIYSGLLRLNDVRLACPTADRFAVVSNDSRRALFVKQLKRPTFKASGLCNLCSFLEYPDVYEWHGRIRQTGRTQ